MKTFILIDPVLLSMPLTTNHICIMTKGRISPFSISRQNTIFLFILLYFLFYVYTLVFPMPLTTKHICSMADAWVFQCLEFFSKKQTFLCTVTPATPQPSQCLLDWEFLLSHNPLQCSMSYFGHTEAVNWFEVTRAQSCLALCHDHIGIYIGS